MSEENKNEQRELKGYYVLVPKGFEQFILVEVPRRVTELEVKVDNLERTVASIDDKLERFLSSLNRRLIVFLVTTISLLVGVLIDLTFRGG